MGHGGVTEKEDKNNGGCWSLVVNGGWVFFHKKKCVVLVFFFWCRGEVAFLSFSSSLFFLFYSFNFFAPSASQNSPLFIRG